MEWNKFHDFLKEFERMNFNIFLLGYIYIILYLHMKFSVSHLFFSYLFIYLFIYLFCAANFMHNININSIDLSFLLPCSSPVAFPFPCLTFLFPLPVSLPCLIPCPASFLYLPMPTSFCLCLIPLPIPSACFLVLPTSAPCLFPCPSFFLALPTSVPYL